jgi:hypothetical protein
MDADTAQRRTPSPDMDLDGKPTPPPGLPRRRGCNLYMPRLQNGDFFGGVDNSDNLDCALP